MKKLQVAQSHEAQYNECHHHFEQREPPLGLHHEPLTATRTCNGRPNCVESCHIVIVAARGSRVVRGHSSSHCGRLGASARTSQRVTSGTRIVTTATGARPIGVADNSRPSGPDSAVTSQSYSGSSGGPPPAAPNGHRPAC